MSDYTIAPIKLHFFRVNQRHHSFAMVETCKRGHHHFMVELLGLDDVDQGYDLASFERKSVADGWGGPMIDLEGWEPYEMTDGPVFGGTSAMRCQLIIE